VLLGAEANFVLDPSEEVIGGLGAGDEVEGGRDCPALLEVTDPQLGPCEFPLLVCLALRQPHEILL
jgi:hypothetical protein